MSTKLTLYRVHKSVLAKHSCTFEDMLSLSDDAEPTGETYEGLPLVAMPDDHQKLRVLLEFMYDPLARCAHCSIMRAVACAHGI